VTNICAARRRAGGVLKRSTPDDADPYMFLAWPRKAGDEAIRAAFCRAAKAYHPTSIRATRLRSRNSSRSCCLRGAQRRAQRRRTTRRSPTMNSICRGRRRQRIQRFAAPRLRLLSAAAWWLSGFRCGSPPAARIRLEGEESRNARASKWAALDDSDSTPRPRARLKCGRHST